MYKKVIKYTDYNGNERTESFYFNISKSELLEMQLNNYLRLDKKLQTIVESNDYKTIVDTFKEIIDRSYGVKSEDGKYFVKNEKVLEEFKSTEAYSELFIELATNQKTASEFVNGIIPKDVDWEEIFKKANENRIEGNVTASNS